MDGMVERQRGLDARTDARMAWDGPVQWGTLEPEGAFGTGAHGFGAVEPISGVPAHGVPAQGAPSFEPPMLEQSGQGLSLGMGGLSLQAAEMPEVGSQLRCSFEGPLGQPVEAAAEVVWVQPPASEDGQGVGEFGLRFVDLNTSAQQAIHRHLETSTRGATSGSDAFSATWRGVAAGVQDPAVARRVPVELHLEGVPSPMEGDVIQDDGEGLLVEQSLPMLRLGTGVRMAGWSQSGRLVSVDLAVQDGVPKLLLEVEYQGEVLPASVPVSVPASALVSGQVSEPGQGFSAEEQAWMDPSVGEDTEVSLPVEEMGVAAPAAMEPDRFEMPEFEHHALEDAAEPGGAAMPNNLWVQMGAWFTAALAQMGALLQLGVRRATPWLGRQVRALLALSRVVLRFVQIRMATLVPALAPAGIRRRTSAPPVNSSVYAGSTRARRAQMEKSQKRRKLLLWAAVGVGLVLLGRQWGWFGGDATTETVEERVPVSGDLGSGSSVGTSPRSGVESGASNAGAFQGATANAVPPASPYGAQPSELRAAAGGGVAVAQEELTTVFGASSVRGKTYLIRMSRPVRGVRGTEEDGGIRVVVPGALSLDRAGPIAATHPKVERAMILNRGDHAELTLWFVAGVIPEYRVAARGTAVEVTIGK